MPTPAWTRVVIGLAAAFWFVAAIVVDAPVDANWIKPVGVVTSAVVLLLLAFDRWFWKWLPHSVTKRPSIDGTWLATLEYEVDGQPTSKECYLVVRQTYSSVRVDLLTDEATSRSRAASVLIEGGRCSLWFSYWSAAGTLQQGGNPPHRGAAELVISSRPTLHMEGDYWTERQTHGTLTAAKRSKHHYDTFGGARQADFN